MNKALAAVLVLSVISSCDDSEDSMPRAAIHFEANTFFGNQFIALSDNDGKVLLLQEVSSVTSLMNFGQEINVTLINKSSAGWLFTTYTHLVSDSLKPKTDFGFGNVIGEHTVLLPEPGPGTGLSAGFGLSCGLFIEEATKYKFMMCDEVDDLYLRTEPEPGFTQRYYHSTIRVGETTDLSQSDISTWPEMEHSVIHNPGMSFAFYTISGVPENGNEVLLAWRIAQAGDEHSFAIPGSDVTDLFPRIKSTVFCSSTEQPITNYQHIEIADAPITHMELLPNEIDELQDGTYPDLAWTSTNESQGYELQLSGNPNGIPIHWTVFGPGIISNKVVLPKFDGDHKAKIGLTTDIDAKIFQLTFFNNFSFDNYREWYTYTIEHPFHPRQDKYLSKGMFVQP